MSIKETVNQNLKDAMRARDQKTVDALRLITAAIKQVEVDERIEVDDARLLVILSKLQKQRQESIEQFKAANRQDLVDQETFELNLIQQYLPQPLSESEVANLIKEAISAVNASQMSDMGKVMAYLKPHLQGRADLGKVSNKIKEALSK